MANSKTAMAHNGAIYAAMDTQAVLHECRQADGPESRDLRMARRLAEDVTGERGRLLRVILDRRIEQDEIENRRHVEAIERARKFCYEREFGQSDNALTAGTGQSA